jgi:hypothetical protein
LDALPGHAVRFVVCRYIDSNYVNGLSPNDLAPERLRRSVLGALRYGKCVVLDLMDVDVWASMEEQFKAVLPGLLGLLISGDIVKEQHYCKLLKPCDGPEYAAENFREDRLMLFRFVVITSLKCPDDGLVGAMKVYRVKAEA